MKKSSEKDDDDSDDDDEDDSDEDDSDDDGDKKDPKKSKEDSDDDDEDSDDSDNDEDSDDESDEDEDSDDDSDDEDEEMKEAESQPSKKRKADEEADSSAKKSKVAEAEDSGIKTLWIGQLSWNVDNDWLRSEFEQYGTVTDARVQVDRDSGRSRGFGYVDFATSAEALRASKEAAGKEVDGRALRVDLQAPRAPKERAESRAKHFNDELSAPSNTLFLGGIAWSLTEDDIWNAFAEYGEVTAVRLPKEIETNRPKGFGYVEFDSQDNATKALEALNGQDLGGRPIRIDYAGARANSNSPRSGSPSFGGRGGRGGMRGGRGGGRGGATRDNGWGSRGGRTASGSARTGAIAPAAGKKMTFDD